jgi:hypothetical protein
MFDVASLIAIGPGEEMLFSMPVNHLSKRWHVEITFAFELPPEKAHSPQTLLDFTPFPQETAQLARHSFFTIRPHSDTWAL